ncbi:putative monovalent cation/H+ antiporter subunit F [Caloramator mitchellensis]|uniref:Putative monovalent cation/H+ antiporter subunit F n=1 Tax=Caloramator mitchellensis TaxID=908809 RepID=A0A0R3JSX6_CALMK|nr:monovalent cation/H+ antiporter complex subunit F [Caloramator mitchellensis]KRQ86608.1 putative monovalent cation/H+ antiporter subunit F [Caloramator mitchellensis]
MIEFVYVGIFYAILAIILLFRVLKGPSVVDRAVAGDSIDILTAVALISFAVFSNRSIYLDIALVIAILGFIGTVLIARYLEGRL